MSNPDGLLTEQAEKLLEQVSSQRLMEYNRTIARWIRLSGSDEERQSLAYVRSVLDGFGFQTTLIEHDAYISLPTGATLTVAGPAPFSPRAITHSMAVTTPPGGIEGEIVAVGTGDAGTLAGLDLTGRIALVDGVAMPGTVWRLENHHPVGMIFINADYTNEMMISTVWGSPTPDNLRLLPRTPVVSINSSDGAHLKNILERGPVRVRIETTVDTRWRQTPILVADLPAAASRDFVLFSGHIDSWHYGAMDNGAANALMLESAGLLAQHRDQLQRGLRIIFWSGHSHGRYSGSTWYTDHHWEELHNHCVAHVNVDSVGGHGAAILSQANSMPELKPLARDAVKAIAGQDFEGTRMARAGDQSFWGVGISSMFITLSEQPPSNTAASAAHAQLLGSHKTGGLGWWWHTTEDTIDKIDPENLARDTRVYVAILSRLLTDPVLPLDCAATARELGGLLDDLQEAAGDRFDLSLARERARQLAGPLERLAARAREVRDQLKAGGQAADPTAQAAAINACLKRVARLLVPLNYTAASPYDQDRAMHLAPLPLLDPVRELAKLAPDSDAARFLTTQLVRARNRVQHALALALERVDAV